MKDIRGVEIKPGAPVATAGVARRAGSGLQVGTVGNTRPLEGKLEVWSATGRTLHRRADEVVILAPPPREVDHG